MSRSHVLVTGATGLIGNAIIGLLAARGDKVRALVRDVARAKALVPEGVELVRGDITEPASIDGALRDARLVYHAAGMPEQWQRDDTIFDRINRQGTVNVLSAAQRAGVERVVYTSTMDVFGAPAGGTLVETNVDPDPKPTAYERSKQAAEREAEKIAREGLDIVYVNPGAVYGPSPFDTALNGFFVRILAGKVPLLPPGGMPVAFLPGVATAHLAAAERGKTGERYLVADEHVTTLGLATEILAADGNARSVPKVGPAWLLKTLSAVSSPLARTFGFAPLIAPGELSFLLWDVRVDASKAKRELGFEPTAVSAGVKATVAALRGMRRRASG